jgi:hypothetical protein
VKSKAVGDTFQLSQICEDIARSTRAKPAQKQDPKTINPTNSPLLDISEEYVQVTKSPRAFYSSASLDTSDEKSIQKSATNIAFFALH